MRRLPAAPCPSCEYVSPVGAATVEAVLDAGRALQNHLEQVHGRKVADAFALAQAWMKEAAAALAPLK